MKKPGLELDNKDNQRKNSRLGWTCAMEGSPANILVTRAQERSWWINSKLQKCNPERLGKYWSHPGSGNKKQLTAVDR